MRDAEQSLIENEIQWNSTVQKLHSRQVMLIENSNDDLGWKLRSVVGVGDRNQNSTTENRHEAIDILERRIAGSTSATELHKTKLLR